VGIIMPSGDIRCVCGQCVWEDLNENWIVKFRGFQGKEDEYDMYQGNCPNGKCPSRLAENGNVFIKDEWNYELQRDISVENPLEKPFPTVLSLVYRSLDLGSNEGGYTSYGIVEAFEEIKSHAEMIDSILENRQARFGTLDDRIKSLLDRKTSEDVVEVEE
jgi:hypothetical protein